MNVWNVLRDVSLIFLVAEVFLLGLIPLAIFGALAYGTWWLRRHRNLPTWLGTARGYFMLGLSYVERGMWIATRPIMITHTACATAKGWVRAVRGASTEDRDPAAESRRID